MNCFGRRAKKNKAICPDIPAEHRGRTGQRLDASQTPNLFRTSEIRSRRTLTGPVLCFFFPLLFINVCCVRRRGSGGQVVIHRWKVKETTRHLHALCQHLKGGIRERTVLAGSRRQSEDAQTSRWCLQLLAQLGASPSAPPATPLSPSCLSWAG